MGKTDKNNPWAFHRGMGRYLRRQYWKTQRQAERKAIQRHETPAPSNHRHGVRWSYW